jgi:hypothetical protein
MPCCQRESIVPQKRFPLSDVETVQSTPSRHETAAVEGEECEMYRSSVRKFIQGVLSLLDEGRDISFEQVAELKDYTVNDVLAMLRVDKAKQIHDGMPSEDWDEIMTYIGRFSTAHGPQALYFYDSTIERSFLCWLAAIGVELLSDV